MANFVVFASDGSFFSGREHFERPADGFDYTNQAWVRDGRYVRCGHPASMNCTCYGRLHAGEPIAANAEVR